MKMGGGKTSYGSKGMSMAKKVASKAAKPMMMTKAKKKKK